TTTSGGTTTTSGGTTTTPIASLAENTAMTLPVVGDNALRIISPTVLELKRIGTKQSDTTAPDVWNFVDANGDYNGPGASEFAVTVNGQSVAVSSVGFRRRAAYAPIETRDLRIDNCLYLTLANPIADGQAVAVKN